MKTQQVLNSEEIFERLVKMAKGKTFLLSDIWHRSRGQFGAAWVEEIVENVLRVFGPEEWGGWEEAIRGYAEFSLDGMRHQEFFEAHGRYRWSQSKEIQEKFYENEEYMMKKYLPGILMSHYLWPHHFKILTFFRTEVLPSLEPAPELFYDVGLGPGMYSRETLRAFPQVRGKGFDISRYSIAFTRKVLEAFGLADRYGFVHGDIFTVELPDSMADFVVSHEVLEHLEEPARFCRILHDLVKPEGYAYITAALNAGLSDHIYLFRSPDEVEAILSQAGWKILKKQFEYAYTGMPMEWTPCIAAYLCERPS